MRQVMVYLLDAGIAYLLIALASFTFLMLGLHLSSKMTNADEREVRRKISEITERPVGNVNQMLNSISFWIYLYVALSWPKFLVAAIKKKVLTKT